MQECSNFSSILYKNSMITLVSTAHLLFKQTFSKDNLKTKK